MCGTLGCHARAALGEFAVQHDEALGVSPAVYMVVLPAEVRCCLSILRDGDVLCIESEADMPEMCRWDEGFELSLNEGSCCWNNRQNRELIPVKVLTVCCWL